MSQSLGCIGLGRMGRNVVLHLLEQGIDVVAYNRTRSVVDAFAAQYDQFKLLNPKGGLLTPAFEVKDIIAHLPSPRVIFLMVPNGPPVDEMVAQLISAGLQSGDTVIDGGNTYYKDTIRRSSELKTKGVHYIDCGTSGGLEGARHGACLMLGGDEVVVKNLNWLWQSLAEPNGYQYFGLSGAGHFVKMVHNGVEYGMNQALGEGFEILSKGPYPMDFAKVAHTWSHGSVVRGWLVELLARAFDSDPKLESYSGKVGGGETGKWMLDIAKELGVEVEVLEEAVEAREKSQTNPTFAGKVVSALRAGYGGHKEPK